MRMCIYRAHKTPVAVELLCLPEPPAGLGRTVAGVWVDNVAQATHRDPLDKPYSICLPTYPASNEPAGKAGRQWTSTVRNATTQLCKTSQDRHNLSSASQSAGPLPPPVRQRSPLKSMQPTLLSRTALNLGPFGRRTGARARDLGGLLPSLKNQPCLASHGHMLAFFFARYPGCIDFKTGKRAGGQSCAHSVHTLATMMQTEQASKLVHHLWGQLLRPSRSRSRPGGLSDH